MSAKTILIADDSEFILKTLRIRLESAGYNVETAVDPSDAMAKVRLNKPDVIIMDVNFPPDVGFGGGGTWDGYRVLEWMKLNHTLNTAIQIIITSEDVEKHEAHAQAAGVDGLFHKPVDARALLDRIKQCLQEKAAAEPTTATT